MTTEEDEANEFWNTYAPHLAGQLTDEEIEWALDSVDAPPLSEARVQEIMDYVLGQDKRLP